MRHHYFGNQLGRSTKQVRALYRNLVSEVLDHGRIETTLAKAKAVRGLVDRTIGYAKKNTVAAQREAVKTLGSDKLLKKLFSEIGPKYSNRNSGYTRIIRLGQRFSDTTEKVILELVEGVTLKIETKPEEKTETMKVKNSRASRPSKIKSTSRKPKVSKK